MSSLRVPIVSFNKSISTKDLHISARHKLLFPSQRENIFVLHHNTSTPTNKPDCHYRSCFNCSALQHITFLLHTRRQCHTECLRDSMSDVIVCLEHRHCTLGLLCVCVCSCYLCYSADDNKCFVKMQEPSKPAFSPAAPLPR